jgi:putative Mg2+ transporter-C (MgtC) family protein
MGPELQILGEVALAMLLGGVIGYEREAANKPAGFRTHMLLAGSAALLVGMAFALVESSTLISAPEAIAADPIRILQAITIGVSFLGAGTIVRGRRPGDVQVLTTAASLLMSSGLGIAVALQQFVLAFGLSLLVFLVLRLVGKVEQRMSQP